MTYFPDLPPLISPYVTFNRPGDVIQYAVNDLVANSTTAATVTAAPIHIAGARGINVPANVLSIRMYKSSSTLLNAVFRVWLFEEDVTWGFGDNGVFTPNKAEKVAGAFDVVLNQACANGVWGIGRPVDGIIRTVKPLLGSINFAAGVQAQGIYTPTAGETFGLAAEVA